MGHLDANDSTSGALTRRSLIASATTVLPAVVLGSSDALADEAKTQVIPTTNDRAVIIARIPNGHVLRAVQGNEDRSVKAVDGVAVLALPVSRNAVSSVSVRIEGEDDTDHRVDTRNDALRKSVLRIANKKIGLHEKDEPEDIEIVHGVPLDKRVKGPLEELFAQAADDDIDLVAISGYRSYARQRSLYDDYVERDGRGAADRYSARPGHSEHQLGLAVDVGEADGVAELEVAFKDTEAGKWVAAHAHEHGFILRYPEHEESVTGYQSEPWHLRYVGEDVAKFMHAKATDIKTLEKLFDLKNAPGY